MRHNPLGSSGPLIGNGGSPNARNARRAQMFVSTLVAFLGLLAIAPDARAVPNSGQQVNTDNNGINFGAWVENGQNQPSTTSTPPPQSACYWTSGYYHNLMAYSRSDYSNGYYSNDTYIFKLCPDGNGDVRLDYFYVYVPPPPPEPSTSKTTNVRDEAWERLVIPKPSPQTAPSSASVVHLPTYVWVPGSDMRSISKTATARVSGSTLSLTVEASPRRRNFLQADMGDGSTVWCDLSDVVPYNPRQDPLRQRSNCSHIYERSSTFGPGDRYPLQVTTYWEIDVSCRYNGRACQNPPAAIPTQQSTGSPLRLAVAEIQALAGS